MQALLTERRFLMSGFKNLYGVAALCRLLPVSLVALALCFTTGCSEETPQSSSTNNTPEKSTASEPETPDDKPAETAAVSSPANEPVEPAETEQPAKKKVVDPSATGSFFGKIVLDGDAPMLEPLAKAGNEELKDKEVCGEADVPDESLIVGDGNGIANVFVYLRRAPKGYKSEVPTEAVVLDQKGCVFTPHVALIQAGQKVLVKSSDAVQHNVHTFPARNQGANLLIKANESDGVELNYSRAESDPLKVKCDIHTWMSSYHLVLDHPFMAVTDDTGAFKIDELPAGDYEFRIWHEKGGLLDRGFKATVTGEDDPVELKFAADKFAG